MRPKSTALLAVILSLALTGVARADTSSDTSAILTNVAANVSHGFHDYSLTMPELEAKIARGEHVSVLCGQVSMLGVRALQRAGIPARYVGAFSSQRADLMDVPANVVESHALLEAWTGARWELYDLDSNVQPIDANGRPVTMTEFADMAPRYYRTLATDALYDPRDDQYPIYEAWLFANHETWYDRVLDIATIYDRGGYVYTGAGSSALLARFDNYRYVSPGEFAAIAAAPPGAPAEASLSVEASAAVAVANPAATAAPAVAAQSIGPAPAAKRARCNRSNHCESIVRRHKLFHVYDRRSHHPRWVYARRAR